MTSQAAAVLGFLGFLLTAGGVGGIETSMNDADMLSAMCISIVGLAIMYCGIAALNVSNYYDNK